MPPYDVSSVEHGNLELCKEQFAISHPAFLVSTLAAVVAYDESLNVQAGRYYACIFERAASASTSGLNSNSKLLMKGIHQPSVADAIKALLYKLSRDVGNVIGADLRTYQMRSGEWERSRDFTVRVEDAAARRDVSVGVGSRIGARLSQLVGNEGAPPPAYRK